MTTTNTSVRTSPVSCITREIRTPNSSSIGIGNNALLNNVSGVREIAIGDGALKSNISGNSNVAIGPLALNNNVSGNYNTSIGYNSMANNTVGDFNIGIGFYSLFNNVTGSSNTSIGYNSMTRNTAGSNNTCLGLASLGSSTVGSNNTAIGTSAARYYTSGALPLTSCSQSVFLGDSTRAAANGGTNEIVIGYNALGNGSNSVTLGNNSITKTILKGNIGVGTTDPKSKLQVNGGIQCANDAAVASVDKVGTMRYRADANNSYVDMCMQTGAATYEWVNIVQNNW